MTHLFAKLTLILALFVPVTAQATADGPDAWRVQGVAAHDHLNVRVGPSVDYFVIDALPHHLQQEVNSYPTWCLVNWTGHQRGWVNRRFLTEDGF